jgi:hypothetical protein
MRGLSHGHGQQTLASAKRLLAGLARLCAEPDDMHVGIQAANAAVNSAYSAGRMGIVLPARLALFAVVRA